MMSQSVMDELPEQTTTLDKKEKNATQLVIRGGQGLGLVIT